MPVVINAVFLFVSFCFLYGLALIVKQCFSKKAPVSSVYALHLDGFRVVIMMFLFLFVPWFTQNIGALLLKKVPNSIDKALWLALLGESSLVLYIFSLLKNDQRLVAGMTQRISKISRLFSDIFEGYCQCLPLLFVVTLFWKFAIDVFQRWGLPVSFDQQPIIQLLAHSKPHLTSIFAISVCVILLAPLCEEIIFRGILLRFLHSHMNLGRSLWTCSLIFAVVHQHFASFLPLCFLGYWLGCYYIKTQCIWINIGIHALFNGTNLILVLAIPEL